MVVVTGQAHSVGIVRCTDHRAGLRAVESVLNQFDMRRFWQVRWLDRAEDVWRGVRCSDELFMDGIACLQQSAP